MPANSIRVFLPLFSMFAIMSCGYRLESVCKPSNGACCAIGTTDIATNAFTDQDFSCQSNQMACVATTTSSYPAHKFNFFPNSEDYRYNGQFNSGCGRTNWVKKSFSETVFGSPSSAPLNDNLVGFKEGLDCRAACNYDFQGVPATGSVSQCPEIALNADAVGSLFKFFSNVNPASYPEDVNQISFAKVASDFGVPPENSMLCKRSDIFVHRNGLVQNIGESGPNCESIVDFTAEGASLQAKIRIASLLSGTVRTSSYLKSWMEYDSAASSFSLAFEDPFISVDYKGHVAKSGMLYDAVVAEISNEHGGKGCVRGRVSDREFGKEIFEEVSDDMLTAVIGEVLKVSGPDFPAQSSAEITTDGIPNSILGTFRKAITSIGNSQLSSLQSELRLDSSEDVQSIFSTTATWLDAAVCNRTLLSVASNEQDNFVAALYERLVGSSGSGSEGVESFLRCAFYPVLVPEVTRNMIETAVFEVEP